MYKNILFDFDGTISDTSIGIINGAKYALNELEIDFSKMNLNDFIGSPLQESFKNICGVKEQDIPNAICLFREYYKKIGLYESKVYVEIEEVLKELLENGCNLFIASSKPTVFIQNLLKKNNLEHYFNYVSGSPLEGACYSKDVVISKIIQKFKLDTCKTIMIGDRKYDIIGAKQNNIHSIGVEYGLGTFKELEHYAPEYIIKAPKDILKVVLE